ncbi:cysteinyl leukotriene receptor 2-like [Nematolebias whitei]|uniref:cysteinyl leukotriene receptor 2-like n=1 Tax=Nematolebias whitei TaxID=451745 RepID=UPI00189C221A|nr:cysteinyl leukotriene receptor 2-like [Nematolebias whitei]
MMTNVSNSTLPVGPLSHCYHDDSAFKYRAYICTYILVFPVAFLCNAGALVVFFQIRKRNGIRRCFEPGTLTSWTKILILNYFGLVLGFLIPFFIIILCYSRVIQHLVAPKDLRLGNLRTRHSRRHSVYLVTMVIATFLLCFLPYHLIRTLHLHAVISKWSCDVMRLLQRAVSVTLCLAACNSMLNPLLYYYATKTFRQDMRKVQTSLRSNLWDSYRHNSVKKQREQS